MKTYCIEAFVHTCMGCLLFGLNQNKVVDHAGVFEVNSATLINNMYHMYRDYLLANRNFICVK